MKSYIVETLSFIESEEIRDYLRGRTDCLNRRICATIVAYAPAPIVRKIPALDLIAVQTEPDPELDFREPEKFAQACRDALSERYSGPPGTIFWLRRWHCEKETYDFGTEFFTEFDAAIRYVKDRQKDYDADGLNYLSYSIEKHIPSENGEMAEQCTWVLSALGDLWYFDYGHKASSEDFEEIWDYCGSSLNLPVPFQSGDIILADCRPFSRERRVLILDIGDNRDCCSLLCMSILPGGTMKLGAFKHNSFHGRVENSHISGLYRARRYRDELLEDEAPLAVLSAAIKENPALSDKISDWIRFDVINNRHNSGYDGANFKELLKYIQER